MTRIIDRFKSFPCDTNTFQDTCFFFLNVKRSIAISILVLTNFVCAWLVASPPIMQTPPSNLTVLDGKDATISCRAIGAPTPNVTWYFNG